MCGLMRLFCFKNGIGNWIHDVQLACVESERRRLIGEGWTIYHAEAI